jgi:hypothetical protein
MAGIKQEGQANASLIKRMFADFFTDVHSLFTFSQNKPLNGLIIYLLRNSSQNTTR